MLEKHESSASIHFTLDLQLHPWELSSKKMIPCVADYLAPAAWAAAWAASAGVTSAVAAVSATSASTIAAVDRSANLELRSAVAAESVARAEAAEVAGDVVAVADELAAAVLVVDVLVIVFDLLHGDVDVLVVVDVEEVTVVVLVRVV